MSKYVDQFGGHEKKRQPMHPSSAVNHNTTLLKEKPGSSWAKREILGFTRRLCQDFNVKLLLLWFSQEIAKVNYIPQVVYSGGLPLGSVG
jgi:hypothetical protein